MHTSISWKEKVMYLKIVKIGKTTDLVLPTVVDVHVCNNPGVIYSVKGKVIHYAVIHLDI